MGVETEIKLHIPDRKLAEKIVGDGFLSKMAFPEKWQCVPMEAVYYDTCRMDLQKAGIAYRVRREGDKWIAAVKKGGDRDSHLQHRQEWNIKVPSPAPDLKPFWNTPVGNELRQVAGNKSMGALHSCRFDRWYLELPLGADTLVELAVDTGKITAGGLREPICEMELELKQGRLSLMEEMASMLCIRYHLIPEPRSKFSRGLALFHRLNPQG